MIRRYLTVAAGAVLVAVLVWLGRIVDTAHNAPDGHGQ